MVLFHNLGLGPDFDFAKDDGEDVFLAADAGMGGRVAGHVADVVPDSGPSEPHPVRHGDAPKNFPPGGILAVA